MSISKNNDEHTKVEQVVVSVTAFFVFAMVGGIIRLFTGPIFPELFQGSFNEYVTIMILSGTVLAVIGYLFPKPIKIIMIFIPIPGASG